MFSCSSSLCASVACSSVLETVGVRVLVRNKRNVSLFSCSSSLCLSAACSSILEPVSVLCSASPPVSVLQLHFPLF
jgi:hypothetical protein